MAWNFYDFNLLESFLLKVQATIAIWSIANTILIAIPKPPCLIRISLSILLFFRNTIILLVHYMYHVSYDLMLLVYNHWHYNSLRNLSQSYSKRCLYYCTLSCISFVNQRIWSLFAYAQLSRIVSNTVSLQLRHWKCSFLCFGDTQVCQ